MIVKQFDIQKIDSLTKYPSIETYHELEEKGILTENINPTLSGEVYITEKIDGTNARIVLLPDGTWLIGQRDKLLTFKTDVIRNPANGIVKTLHPHADRIQDAFSNSKIIITVYMEVYGGNINNWKNYTSDKKTFGWRIFDVAVIADWEDQLTNWSCEQIASWRQNNGQQFINPSILTYICEEDDFPKVPDVHMMQEADMPVSVEDTYNWLQNTINMTNAALDDNAKKRPEGVVVRDNDRNIAKIRFEDYERTMRKREQK